MTGVETLSTEAPKKIRLDHKGLHEYQANRFPYLMIDVAEEIVPGVSARGYKNLTINDWFFECHFPGDPNMPGMLQLEAIVQLSALMIFTLPGNKGKIAYVTSIKNVKFRKKVLPGDRFEIESKLRSWKRGMGDCWGRATVNGELACEAEFSLVLPDVINQFAVTLQN